LGVGVSSRSRCFRVGVSSQSRGFRVGVWSGGSVFRVGVDVQRPVEQRQSLGCRHLVLESSVRFRPPQIVAAMVSGSLQFASARSPVGGFSLRRRDIISIQRVAPADADQPRVGWVRPVPAFAASTVPGLSVAGVGSSVGASAVAPSIAGPRGAFLLRTLPAWGGLERGWALRGWFWILRHAFPETALPSRGLVGCGLGFAGGSLHFDFGLLH